jgi:signal-transduction protein with cAMP-binding, CBS, and nucleotidyltransferase domain
MQTPISLNQHSTVYDAAEKILSQNISGVIINMHDRYGILSQKDIAVALLSENQNIKDILASQKMQELVLVDQYAPISNCASLMLSKKTNTLGVKDSHGVKGIMTKHDLVRFFQQNIVDETRLTDIMSVGSFFVSDTTPLYSALAKMLDNQISRILIKNSKNKPIGIVTFKSFLRNAVHNSNRDPKCIFSTGFGKTCTVNEIMKKQIISVSIQTSLAKLAKILIDYRIHGVAVTKNQKIIGFVTEKDIVRQLARMDSV